jgi:hypothetical protein
MKQLLRIALPLLALLLLAACGSDPVSTQEVTIQGILYGPDGRTPMPNATVYSPQGAASARLTALQASDGTCAAPATPGLAYTCTGVDGSFSLTTEHKGSEAALVAFKGSWSIEFTVEITGPNVTIADPIQFPTDPDLGAARIAVVNGSFDDMGGVLTRLGMDTYDEFSEYPFGTDSFHTLFAVADGGDRAKIYEYDLVFFNCGSYAATSLPEEWIGILRTYVEEGGSIYATDWAYNFVEQPFPEFLDFRGDDPRTAPGRASLEAVVLDDTLHSWLGMRECSGGDCLAEDGTLLLGRFLPEWVGIDGVMDSEEGASVKVWVEGDLSAGGAEADVVPLTVTFNVGEGRVLFTSYHSSPGSWDDDFLPQERVLEYLVFEL